MSAAVAISPTSGNITAKLTACNVSCTGTANNDTTAFDAAKYPTEPEIKMYFRARKTGADDLKSNVFSTNPSGLAEWPSVIFPSAGSWTLSLRKAADDSEVATAAVTVN